MEISNVVQNISSWLLSGGVRIFLILIIILLVKRTGRKLIERLDKVMKQWDTLKEFRRRLKIAFDEQGIEIPFPQMSIWSRGSLDK